MNTNTVNTPVNLGDTNTNPLLDDNQVLTEEAFSQLSEKDQWNFILANRFKLARFPPSDLFLKNEAIRKELALEYFRSEYLFFLHTNIYSYIQKASKLTTDKINEMVQQDIQDAKRLFDILDKLN